MHGEAAQFHALFKGNEAEHGCCQPTGKKREDGKALDTLWTKAEPVTDDKWSNHRNGKLGIGIVPIDPETNLCRWGAIDLDDKFDSHKKRLAWVKQILQSIESLGLPLIACFSKSLGLHLYLFCAEPFLATDVVNCLTEMCLGLKLGRREIFPKQDENVRVGNWLNMPYFGNTRRCITLAGEVDSTSFLKLAKQKAVHSLFKVHQADSDETFPDGPPCLQYYAKHGPVELDEKHMMVWNLAVYYRQAHPGNWQELTRAANENRKLLPAAHKYSDVEKLIEDQEKTNYGFSCLTPPICKHCDQAECIKRKFGVARGKCTILDIVPYTNGQITVYHAKMASRGVVKRVEIVGSKELYDYRSFCITCMDQIQDFPPVYGSKEWIGIIRDFLGKNEPIITTTTIQEAVLNSLTQYCIRQKTQDREQLLVVEKKTYWDIRRKRIWLKLNACLPVLQKEHAITLPTLELMVEELGGKKADQLMFKGNKNRKMAWIPWDSVLETLPELELAELEEEPI